MGLRPSRPAPRKAEVPEEDQPRLVQEAFKDCFRANNGSLMLPISGAYYDEKSHNETDTREPEPYCQPIWDGLACWPKTTSGDTAILPCPTYVNEFLLAA
ncbi:hypothetical protein RRG08_002279 [Elysia crispata]|uniref:G-protein coupled receptors family 2 profile 1 domain-containing protein n=1 Tax=Elysia crispata TaxID=231223 RepID=A0AAE0ZB25_9GAST|nr:hypothetical protein RRG08_002279 [Elysia crispata]